MTPVTAIPNTSLEWEILDLPKRLARSYKFDNQQKLQEFINELLDYERKTNHSGEISISHGDVLIEVFTKDLNSVTELDYEYAKMADLIYRDVEAYHDTF